MDKTYLDELVEYPVKVLQRIGTNKNIVALLTNNPDVDLESPEADAVFDKYLYDYEYVDPTVTEASAYICVEADMAKPGSSTINDFRLYITVSCHKNFMSIDHSMFKGVVGNRRDNLVRYIDSILSGSDILGIGRLRLTSVRVVPSPVDFVTREMTYEIPEFMDKGVNPFAH